MKSYSATLNLPKGKYKAEWMDVSTGKHINSYEFTNSKIILPAGLADKVLVVKKISK